MGVYLNPGNEKFAKAVQSEIYVDKTGLIEYTNQVINTVQRYVCVSRPRRFGKSMTADMLTAYYGKECDSRELFSGLKISQNAVFAQHLNQYPTIFLNMQEFLSRSKEIGQVIDRVRRMLLRELKNSYPDVDYFDDTDLVESLQDIYAATKQSFVIIIDEWDCVFREYQQDKKAQEEYLDFLRDFLKDKVYVALAYLTGILPIKKYGTHSALNMFDEFTMLDPGPLAEYVGFTEQEVEELCGRYQMDLAEIKNWYDGYSFPGESSVYSPRSVVNAMRFRKIGNYWNQTETFEALQWYIDLNFDGLRDDVLQMMAGKKVIIRTLDIGADKNVDYLGLGKEDNPAMGYRAIRICLEQPEIFKTQLRALLRAAKYGTLAIMYPMIISVEEVLDIQKIVAEVAKELEEEKLPYAIPEQGIMIETPAAVMMSEELAEHVDFFSIGTNDLTQYTLAIDRQNNRLDRFYNPHHEAVLRMIQMTVDGAHKHGKWVGICGELGADTTLTTRFVQMGIDELSVAPSMVLNVRSKICEME